MELLMHTPLTRVVLPIQSGLKVSTVWSQTGKTMSPTRIAPDQQFMSGLTGFRIETVTKGPELG